MDNTNGQEDEAVVASPRSDFLRRDSILSMGSTKSWAGRRYPKTRKPTPRGERWVLLYSPRKMHVDQQEWERFERIQAHAPPGKDGLELPSLDKHDPARRRLWVPFLPSDGGVLMWDVLLSAVDASYSAFFIPLSLAFHDQLVLHPSYTITNWVAASMFALDVLLGFLTGFAVVHDRDSIMVTSLRETSSFFIMHSNFVPDVLVVASVIIEQVLVARGSSMSWGIRYVVLLRCSRLIRVFWLIQLLMYNTFIGNLMSTWTDVDFLFLGIVLYSTAVFLHLLAVFWYFIAAVEGTSRSWLATKTLQGQPLVNRPYWQQYVASLHFVTVTVSTIGYGDVTPNSPLEQIVSIFMMLIGVVFFGIVITSSQELVKRLSKSARTAETLRAKMKAVEDWARHRKLNPDVFGDICLYYANTWLPHSEEAEDGKIFKELPADLRTRVASDFTRHLLDTSDIFSCLSEGQKTRLCSYLHPVTAAAGHDLCRSGDEVTGLWLLQEGLLEMRRHGKVLKLVHAPAIVGEAGVAGVLMMLHQPHQLTPNQHQLTKALHRRATTLRAICHCRLWHIDMRHLELVAGMERGTRDLLIDAFRNVFKKKMNHFPEEVPGIWEGTVTDPLGSKADTKAMDELAQADTEELQAEAVSRLFRNRSALSYTSALSLRWGKPQSDLPFSSPSGPR